MATTKETFIKRVIGAKKGAESNLQAIGARIRKNVEQGQADLRNGKIQTYGSINPLK